MMERRRLLAGISGSIVLFSGCIGTDEGEPSTETEEESSTGADDEVSSVSHSVWELPPCSSSNDHSLKLLDFHEGDGVKYPQLAIENTTTKSVTIRNFTIATEYEEREIFDSTRFEAQETKTVVIEWDIRDKNNIAHLKFQTDTTDSFNDVCYSTQNLSGVANPEYQGGDHEESVREAQNQAEAESRDNNDTESEEDSETESEDPEEKVIFHPMETYFDHGGNTANGRFFIENNKDTEVSKTVGLLVETPSGETHRNEGTFSVDADSRSGAQEVIVDIESWDSREHGAEQFENSTISIEFEDDTVATIENCGSAYVGCEF